MKQPYEKPILKKESIEKYDNLQKAEKNLLQRADRLSKKEFKSIIDKKATPPSGDKRDFLSRAIYYWPDENDARKAWKYVDGKVNKKSLEETDHFTYFDAMGAIRDLSMAYNLKREEKYAKKAFEIVDQWFINEKTRMNPNFKYAQAIPGKNEGSHWGIISSRAILWVSSGLELMKESEHFDQSNYDSFVSWCSNYLDWLLTSSFGLKEAETGNNHATYYALQVIELADFTQQYDLCQSLLFKVRDKRIPEQIMLDGSMPQELKRTRPIHYSLFNLSAFFHIAIIGDKYNMDLWESKTDTSGSIINAFDFILNEVERVKEKKNVEINYSYLSGLLTIANVKFDNKYNNYSEEILRRKEKIKLIDTYFVF